MKMAIKKNRYIQIIREGMGSYTMPISSVVNVIDGEFDGSDAGDKITLQLIEMTDAEYEALPEFMGW